MAEQEKVSRLAIAREEGFTYSVKGAAVFRKRSGGTAEKVADLGFQPEKGYVYFVDADGDIARSRLGGTPGTPGAPAAAKASPVTLDKALAPIRAHLGKAVHLRLAKRTGELRAGSHPVTLFDWSKLPASARSMFAESHVLELARALGGGWSDKQVPFALVGGESHPVPLDELDQQADGVLLVDLANGEVLCCSDPTARAAAPLASSTAALAITAHDADDED
jgi:hypothetical protein